MIPDVINFIRVNNLREMSTKRLRDTHNNTALKMAFTIDVGDYVSTTYGVPQRLFPMRLREVLVEEAYRRELAYRKAGRAKKFRSKFNWLLGEVKPQEEQ